MKRLALPLLLIPLLLIGCVKKEEPAGLSKNKGTVAGVQWSVPGRWSVAAQRQMRVATYFAPPAAGDSESAECAVSFFGPGQGGNIDLNIDRWFGQFEGGTIPEKASREVGGVKVTTVKISGTYTSPGGPMMQSMGKKPGYKLTGAIVEAPGGTVFFKMTGPVKSVEKAEAEFDAMIGSLRK
jgi:hypothetical protein